jgi:hypothetical protein
VLRDETSGTLDRRWRAWSERVAVAAAFTEAFHVVAVVLEVVLITIASAVGLAVLAGLGWLGIKARRHRTNRAAAAEFRPVCQAVPVAPEPRAIEPPKLRIDGGESYLCSEPSAVERS